jgi:hypothetical protein
MSSKILRRKEARAKRRKQVLAERRKLGGASNLPLATRVRRLAAMPLRSCMVQDGLFERGNGMMILARQQSDGQLAVAGFLLDVFCLGVKDVFFRPFEPSEFDEYMDIMGQEVPLSDVDPAYARKLLRDTVAYARSLGLEPHPDFAGVEPVFGEISAEACDVSFEFGLDGKPFYIPGPHESAKQIDRRLRHLQERLGDDGFDVALDDDDEDDADDDDILDDELELPEGAAPYDPEVAPNPKEWLARSEDERRLVIEAYHRGAGIRVPNQMLHAIMHVAVENQIALGDEVPVRRAIDRLMADGLDRHEALHAAGTVLFEHLTQLMHDVGAAAGAGAGTAESVSHEAYYAALEQLTADGWRRSLEEDEDEDPDEEA